MQKVEKNLNNEIKQVKTDLQANILELKEEMEQTKKTILSEIQNMLGSKLIKDEQLSKNTRIRKMKS